MSIKKIHNIYISISATILNKKQINSINTSNLD